MLGRVQRCCAEATARPEAPSAPSAPAWGSGSGHRGGHSWGRGGGQRRLAVSYTHLTLPTICSV
eukprot:4979728-Alexandrium_andersonii.AAC.1